MQCDARGVGAALTLSWRALAKKNCCAGVELARPQFLSASKGRSCHYHHQHFLVYVNSCYLVRHSFLLAWKRQNAREQGYTPSRATALPVRMGGATQIGSKRTFQIKLIDGLTSSRVQTTFAVHA